MMCYSTLVHKAQNGLIIPQETAEALNVEIGDRIRYITPIGETRGDI